MGAVTCGTLAGQRLVPHVTLEVGSGVATDTELLLRRQENRGMIRAVRVVAGRATPDPGVEVLGPQAEILRRVTVEAEVGLVLLESEGADQSMGPMTRTAIALRHGSVRHLGDSDNIRVAAGAGPFLVETGAFR
jgi:hypothetical protein